MFATLDDLAGRLELFIRDATGAVAEAIETDRVVVVRGRIDHKGGGETSLVVSEAELFEPDPDELAMAREKAKAAAGPLTLRIDAGRFGVAVIEDLKALFESYPGENEVLLEMRTRDGVRRLRFGSGYRVTPSTALRAEIDQLLGPAAIAA
jgi:DNA polymerase-3 subunit alpha